MLAEKQRMLDEENRLKAEAGQSSRCALYTIGTRLP